MRFSYNCPHCDEEIFYEAEGPSPLELTSFWAMVEHQHGGPVDPKLFDQALREELARRGVDYEKAVLYEKCPKCGRTVLMIDWMPPSQKKGSE